VNLDDIDYFYSQSANERVPCDTLADLNLQPWAEAPPAPPAAHHAPAFAQPREAAELLPVAVKTARAGVENFLDAVAPERRTPVFRKHGRRA